MENNSLLTIKHFLILIIFVFILIFAIQPSHFFYESFEEGKFSQNNIIANKTVTFIDEPATNELKNKVLTEVENTYDKDPIIYQNIEKDINNFLASVSTYKSDFGNNELQTINKKNIDSIPLAFGLSKAEVSEIVKLENTEISNYLAYMKANLRNQYDDGLTEDGIIEIKAKLVKDPNLYLFPEILRMNFTEKIIANLKPNFKMNETESNKRKQEALLKVEPVYKKIVKGEAVIRKYDEITVEHIAKLEALDLTNQKFLWSDIFKFLPSILLYTLIFHFYCNRYLKDKLDNLRKYTLMLVAIIVTVLSTYFIQGTSWYFIPTITLLIIFSMFWNRSFVLMTSIYLALLMNYEDVNLLILTIVIGASLATFKDNFNNFTDAIKNGLFIGLILSSTQVVLVYTLEQRFFIDDFPEILASGVFAGIIANGIIPLLEKMLGIATIYKLTELNKYDHPILEELYKKARGTYEHSRNVAHLVSVASYKIGTNTLLLKVAALYHDLGKIENAEFFIENSTPSSNVHNMITPLESAKIILEHPHKSIELCYKHHIPKEVIDLIETHHGDSALMHFYQKELEINENANIEDFRYTTPKPKTKEQGILLLADATEAYSRSLIFKTEKELEEQLRTFIYKKIKNGELKNCELTTREVEICIEEFSEAIFATQHKRVPYRTEKVEKD
mgnify:FL=1